MPNPLDNVKPLFVITLDALWAGVRLSGADDSVQDDTAAIMRAAVVDARLFIYERLGSTRVTQILTTTEVSTPTTDAELDRSRASLLEIKVVRRRLMRDLPILFRDAGQGTNDEWNQDPLTRPGMDDLKAAIDALTADIENDIAILDADDETSPGLLAASFGPPTDKVLPVPGGSVLRHPPNVWNENPGLPFIE